jgi:hypothetical protein
MRVAQTLVITLAWPMFRFISAAPSLASLLVYQIVSVSGADPDRGDREQSRSRVLPDGRRRYRSAWDAAFAQLIRRMSRGP